MNEHTYSRHSLLVGAVFQPIGLQGLAQLEGRGFLRSETLLEEDAAADMKRLDWDLK